MELIRIQLKDGSRNVVCVAGNKKEQVNSGMPKTVDSEAVLQAI